MNIRAAFRSPLTGIITVGQNHFEAFALSDVPDVKAITEQEFFDSEGFLIDGVFHSREQTFAITGCYCIEEL